MLWRPTEDFLASKTCKVACHSVPHCSRTEQKDSSVSTLSIGAKTKDRTFDKQRRAIARARGRGCAASPSLSPPDPPHSAPSFVHGSALAGDSCRSPLDDDEA